MRSEEAWAERRRAGWAAAAIDQEQELEAGAELGAGELERRLDVLERQVQAIDGELERSAEWKPCRCADPGASSCPRHAAEWRP
jgi:hypothetical protein